MHPNVQNLANHRFGRLTVLRLTERRQSGGVVWLCACECGNACMARGCDLKSGNTKSCGCLNREETVARSVTHGATRGGKHTAEYEAWAGAGKRCTNPKDRFFRDYGGRGITVCDRWKSFALFLADMGERPSPKHSIDRIDPDGNYDPDNCRWADIKTQSRNKRNAQMLTLNGVTRNIANWADLTGIHYRTLKSRINQQGWAIEKALTTPSRNYNA